MTSPLGRPPQQYAKGRQALLLAACCLVLSAFSTAAKSQVKPTGPIDGGKGDTATQPAVKEGDAPRKTLDQLKLPQNSVIVITDEIKEALKLIPKGVLLTPEEHQKIMEELARLRGQVRTEKAIPTDCRLTGRVEGDLVRLQAEFGFQTHTRHAQVMLNCSQAHPRAVSMDGQLPVLHLTPDGYVLQVDEPGPHKAILDLDLAVQSRGAAGSQRGFALDLPSASVTTLDLEVPASVKEVRLGKQIGDATTSQSAGTRPLDDQRYSRVDTGGALGAVKHLDLTWKGPASRPMGPPLLAANGFITVQMTNEPLVKTTAEITLEVLRGQVSQWQLQVPPKAIVQLKSTPAEDRAVTIEPNATGTLQTIRFKEPSAEPLVVVVELEQPRGPSMAVGPFHVLGAFRQRGMVMISAPQTIPLRFTPRNEVSPREVTAEDVKRAGFKPVAAFTYWNLPAPEKPQTQAQALLTLESETVKGMIEAHTNHTLTLTDTGWKVVSKFTVTPPRLGEVEELQIELPPDWQPGDRREPVKEIQHKPGTREATLLLTERQVKTFVVQLEGLLPLPPGARQAALELPRLKSEQLLDRGGEMTASVPNDQELLTPSARETIRREGLHRYTVPFERMPGRIELAWRAYRQDQPVDAIVDITLSGNQATVRHRLWAPAPQTLPQQFSLRIPEVLAKRIRGVERGHLKTEGREATSPLVETTSPTSKTNPLILEYWFTLPANGGPFAVPLVVPEHATRGDLRVRIWSDPGSLPVLAGGPWLEVPIEVVGDQPRLPDLCLRGARLDLPLSLRVQETGTAPQATVLVEKALVRATVVQAGQHHYWASFRVSQLRAPYLDIELPAAPSALGLKVFLTGETLQEVPWQPVSDSSPNVDTSRLARLKIDPRQLARPGVLDVIYQIGPNQPAARSSGYVLGNIALQTTLHAPLLHGSGDRVPVRWEVRLPSEWVPLYTGGGFQFEQRWGWRGWLLAPRPAVSSTDLEKWFYGDAEHLSPSAAPGTPGVEASTGPPSVVCWRTDLEPLRLNHAPQQPWLLTCSLTLLAVGLGLYFLLVQRGLYWPVVVLLGVVAALVGLLWPNVLAVVFYGCEPGLVVLLLVFGVSWLMQHRYRRQVVFLPGFTRLKGGSSVTRSVSSHRVKGEPSTVDAPPVGSGQRRGGSSISKGSVGTEDEVSGEQGV